MVSKGSKQRNRVVISGYYGFSNLGDEAVLYSILRVLRHSVPELEVTVLSNEPRNTARDYGVHAVDRWNMREVAGAVRRADLLISGGGSLLQDVTGLQSLMYYLGVIWLARFFRRPVMYYAQGIGPVTTKAGRRLVGLTTQRVQAVTVRDAESLQDLQAMGVRRPVEVTADPVLGLRPGDIDLSVGAEILRRHDIQVGSGVVGVSVRPLPGPPIWEMELAKACDRLARAGRTIVFLPMQSPADLVASREVAAAMRESRTIISTKLSVPQMISLVGNLDLLVGMRLHALIFAAVCGVPPVGIAYDPKVERFLSRLGLAPAGKPAEIESQALAQQAETYLSNKEQLVDDMARKLEDLQQAAAYTAELVRKLVPGVERLKG
ncbi:polysaccharide pyruvyl transferase CsaB [Desulfoscipio gibsoniae]|uniref:polysaccharide pyruvyl transferase CsaB n=1 Tax=Desulfoscipio gibsoniae TaxID=102134 RepID=UPI0003134C67|nr:polysaccharide pyruvyl transferase CsaB [Desulfoscipio gibsoniae]